MKHSSQWDEDFEFGRLHARKMVGWLMQKRVGVVMASDRLGGNAPLYADLSGGLPLLDLLLFWRGNIEAWDVKAKRKVGHLDLANTLTTGANAQAVDGYRTFERRTRIPCRVVFVHPTRDEVLLARLRDFNPRLTRGNGGSSGQRLEYCAVDKLEWLCSFQELDSYQPAQKEDEVNPRPAWLRQIEGFQLELELPARPHVGVKGWPLP